MPSTQAKQNGKKRPAARMTPLALWQRFVLSRKLIGALTLFLLVSACLLYPYFKGIPVRPGDTAPETYSYKEILKREDIRATEAARKRASDGIEQVYLLDGLTSDIQDVLEHVNDVKRGGLFKPSEGHEPVAQELLEYMFLSPSTVEVLLQKDTDSLTVLFSRTVSLLRDVAGGKMWLEQNDLAEIETRTRTMTGVGRLDEKDARVIRDLIKSLAVRSFDSAETDRRRTAAAAAIKPVVVSSTRRIVIVRKGDMLTEQHLAALTKHGIRPHRSPVGQIAGGLLFLAFTFTLMGIYIPSFARDVYGNDKKVFMFYILLLITAVGALLIYVLHETMPGFSAYALGIPIGVLAILTCFLIKPRLSLVTVPLSALCFCVIMKLPLNVFIVALVCGLLGSFYTTQRQEMDNIIKAGIAIALGSMAVIAIMNIVQFTTYRRALMDTLVFGALNGLLTSVLATGILPLFERAFNIVTPHRLLELSNPEHPLLKELLINAPGTYHHSIFVGNLAETAADTVGADPLLIRIAAYYHDVGKLKRPYFFGENQISGHSQLDEVTPTLGSLVVSSHVKDGIEMMNEHRLPNDIIRIASEHHGTCLISFFFQRARAEARDPDNVSEARFRYPGPSPSTRESAILMLCDSCEAAVRSLKEPTARNIENTVNNIVKARLVDGQFDHCDITLAHIDTVRRMLADSLARIYHARIQYPDEDQLRSKLQETTGGEKTANGKG